MARRIYSVLSLCLVAGLPLVSGAARAQAGPPFLTNDPGTPGNANWEINVGSMQALAGGRSRAVGATVFPASNGAFWTRAKAAGKCRLFLKSKPALHASRSKTRS